MSRGPQDFTLLPEGWLERLFRFFKLRWHFATEDDVARHCEISLKTLRRAKKDNKMTNRMFRRLVEKSGYEDPDDLLRVLDATAPAAEFRGFSAKPTTLALTPVVLDTSKTTPQWTNYRELPLRGNRLQSFFCSIETTSQYFRFGLKLLAVNGRLFGDGCIQSQDANVVVHVGRNKGSRDVFLTSYRNGVRENLDRVLFPSPLHLTASIALVIDAVDRLRFTVNESHCYECMIPRSICCRAAMMAWGDQDEYSVNVKGQKVTFIA
jgi:hypothetical protein